MSLETWVAYILTILVMMSTPGPSHLLMLSNSMAHGFRPSLATAAGDLTANMLQMLAAGLGLAGLVFASADVFLAVKWAGVAYLVYLGVTKIRAAGRLKANPGALPDGSPRRRTLFLQGFLTSAANPKAVVFFAALFPLFLDPRAPLAPQLFVLGLTYVAVDGSFLATYGGLATWFNRVLRGRGKLWMDRLSGGFLIVAAMLLGFKEMEAGQNQVVP